MTTGAPPALVLASHGTSDDAGQRAVLGLVEAVAARADTHVVGCFVDVQAPDVPTALAGLPAGRAAVIVPLLLSTGYHVRVDIARAVRSAAPRPVVATDALGPDARLTDLLARRLREAGFRPGDHLVLAGAGSSDPSAVDDCHAVARSLGALLDQPVAVGFLASAEPRLGEVVAGLHHAHPGERVAVSTYLLAPGYFAQLASRAVAGTVSAPLLLAEGAPDPALVDVVLDRYREAAARGA